MANRPEPVLRTGQLRAPWVSPPPVLFNDRMCSPSLPRFSKTTVERYISGQRQTSGNQSQKLGATSHFPPSAYDLAVAANLCHLFDETANRRLLRRLFDAVRPNGTVAIADALPNERLHGPRWVFLYGLGLLWRTERGQVYPFSTYVGWLRDTGYQSIERLDLAPTPPITLITGRRP